MHQYRALFIADGPSDHPLAGHVASLVERNGVSIRVITPDFQRLSGKVGRDVYSRIEAMQRIATRFDLLIVHRDAEKDGLERRRQEIDSAVERAGVTCPVIRVVPVRMTEAWLLGEEGAIRRVAGRPSSSVPLGLPPIKRAEDLPDPKGLLATAIEKASQHSGRRLAKLRRDFSEHRRQLLQDLDIDGVVAALPSWQRLVEDVCEACEALKSSAGATAAS